METLDEGTVAWLGDARVPMGNVRECEYELADGTIATGMACSVSPPEGRQLVGAGSAFVVDGVRWVVEEVRGGPGGTGWCRVRAD